MSVVAQTGVGSPSSAKVWALGVSTLADLAALPTGGIAFGCLASCLEDGNTYRLENTAGVPTWEVLTTGAGGTVAVGAGLTGDGAALTPLVASAAAMLKASCAVVSVANLTLSGEQTIDGVTTSASRILVTGQSTPSQNGIYTTAAGAWARTTDADATAEITQGMLVPVTGGTLYAGSTWMLSTASPTIGGSLAFLQVGPPSFGADTIIKLPNSAGTLKNVLELLTEYSVNTASSELSRITYKMLTAGAVVDALLIAGNLQMQVPDALYFIKDLDTGFYRSASNTIAVLCGNLDMAFWSTGGLVLNATTGANIQWSASGAGIAYTSANGNLKVGPATSVGNVDLGLVGGALATNASHGFPTFPSCAGTPTGTPTVTTGQVPLVVDTTNNKLYGYYGAAWHDLTG